MQHKICLWIIKYRDSNKLKRGNEIASYYMTKKLG